MSNFLLSIINIKAIHAVYDAVVVMLETEPDFVCVMICIQENTEENRHVHSLVLIEFYGYSL